MNDFIEITSLAPPLYTISLEHAWKDIQRYLTRIRIAARDVRAVLRCGAGHGAFGEAPEPGVGWASRHHGPLAEGGKPVSCQRDQCFFLRRIEKSLDTSFVIRLAWGRHTHCIVEIGKSNEKDGSTFNMI